MAKKAIKTETKSASQQIKINREEAWEIYNFFSDDDEDAILTIKNGRVVLISQQSIKSKKIG